ncbi:MAG: HesA/MoeB/ThiF family protein, partial [Nitrosopumilus sp.]|nr:HesA/MoeB/ThiF family protein [Nitrosopumilus sp.]
AVAGGSEELSTKELDRFSRQVMLEEIGYNGQLKLKNARVCVVGTGGLGNPITSRLAAMGVGTLRIVDRDVIELSNLHRQTMFDEDDVGQVKVEVAEKKLQKLNPDCKIEALAVSVNDYTALEVVEGCDVVVDALDSVNARYALNKACVKFNIPFVTGAAVGVSGQAFTILPKTSACYYCMFPSLDEDSMPTCSIEGVHPSILSIIGGIEVTEAIKVILGKKPSLSEKILHVDIENLDFTTTRTFRAEECPVCGTGTLEEVVKEELILEELCGRNRGKRTFSVTPTSTFDLDVNSVTAIAKEKGFLVDNQGELGLSLRTNEMSVSFMKKGSAVIVGPKDETDAVSLYNELLGKTISKPAN